MFSIEDVIDIAIQIEKNGEALLRSAQRKINDPELSSLFRWIADEEVRHAELFAGMKPEREEKKDTAELEAMGRHILRDMMAQESFSLNEDELSRLDRMEALLLKMIEFEKDTVIFYEMIRSFVTDPAAIGAVDQIIAQEKQHAAALQGFLTNDN